MLKKERFIQILEIVNRNGIVTVNDLIDKLGVSDMTIRRDLSYLEEMGKLIRVHGGCQSLSHRIENELDHTEKKSLYRKEKTAIAKTAVSLIDEGDTLFLSTGTTIELFTGYFKQKFLRIVTNSLPVFESLQGYAEQYEIILLGGNYRQKTGAFIGSIPFSTLEKMRFSKSFVGVNGIYNNELSTSNTDEGQILQKALDNSDKKYIVADYHKLNKTDFYNFYPLNKIDALITNSEISQLQKEHYRSFTQIIDNNS